MATTGAQRAVPDYRYHHVTSQVLSDDMVFRDAAPEPGEPLPDFDLPTTDGRRIRTDDFVSRKPLLLITGSLTCPMTASSNPKLRRLHEQFGSEIAFVMLHVREAHPGEHYDQPESFETKLEHARSLKRRDRLPWPVAVDDVQGTVHRSLDEKPNAVYLTDRSGQIVFRGLWAGDVEGLRQALNSVAQGERPHEPESSRRFVPMVEGTGVMYEMVRRSGPRAEADIWRAAPPMAALAWVADFYYPLPPKWRTLAAFATVVALSAAAISLVVRTASRQTRRIRAIDGHETPHG